VRITPPPPSQNRDSLTLRWVFTATVGGSPPKRGLIRDPWTEVPRVMRLMRGLREIRRNCITKHISRMEQWRATPLQEGKLLKCKTSHWLALRTVAV
jgi:hypothetical protein